MNLYQTFPQTGTQSFKQPSMQNFHPSSAQGSIDKTKPAEPRIQTQQTQQAQSIQPTQPLCETQTHVHEFEGSTKLAEEGDDRHNHRFAGVTSQVIPVGNSHVHGLFENTDFLDHHHEIAAITGLPIDVGGGKHVHFVQSVTTMDDGHFHEFQFATLILSPLV